MHTSSVGPARTQAGAGDDPVIEAYKRDVDRTLLRANLARSIDDRLRNLMALQAFAAELREAGRKARRRA